MIQTIRHSLKVVLVWFHFQGGANITLRLLTSYYKDVLFTST